ncbi:hypothetical protein NUU61_006024 [Penicillium alfredii]|uniref:Uncharacterized protein n=1 Tax=Penicillium alfredii TaxID=1506179 RepID=A0A9W9K2X6_9EURO|nr:uncharacterized protein NUU61_006024 [Penicillium alfredii]KAJ5091154.1 hypothetical protein NUU61_006024 [Penicillium alfredii]
MSDLLGSRWAPGASETQRPRAPRQRSPYHSPLSHSHNPDNGNGNGARASVAAPSPGALLPPAEELARFMKIVARLRWKLPFLAEGYRLATLTVGNGVTDAEVAHAEIMFKIDFHEYYALLERAIVHLLAVFNVTVTSAPRGSSRASRVPAENGGAPLKEETTPLAPILGSGHVHEQLQKAKELRNRWKTADMTREEKEQNSFAAKQEVMPLASYDLESILTGIFAGLEEAYGRARGHVDWCKRPGEAAGDEMESESDWGFMVDAMDWQAV